MAKIYYGICEQCGQPYSGRGQRFCSNSCRVRWTNLHRNVAKRPEVKEKIRLSALGNKRCQGRILSEQTKEKIASKLRGRPLLDEVKQKIREKALALGLKPPQNQSWMKGEKHPNWKGGLSPQRQLDFASPEYKAFVKVCLERDNYTCQRCGARNGNGYDVYLQVHHIKPWGPYPELRYNPDNGITLCFDCHNLTKGKRPTTVDFVPKKVRTCQICGITFSIFNPRKYCSECRLKYCCPVCGSTTCKHSARKLYCSQPP